MEKTKEQIVELIAGPLANEGCELADIKVSKYKTNTNLRLFVYGEGGVSLDKCAHLSRVVGDIIDGTDLFERGYTLEVSSPGLDRPLVTARDFNYRKGETVRIGFADHARSKITAEIVSASDDCVLFRNEDGEFRIAVDEIEMAKIVF